MSHQRIMYVCSDCADGNPEGCGHYDRSDLRVLPDGRWLCESCFDETDQVERGVGIDEHKVWLETDEFKGWGDFPMPPEYVADTSQIQNTQGK